MCTKVCVYVQQSRSDCRQARATLTGEQVNTERCGQRALVRHSRVSLPSQAICARTPRSGRESCTATSEDTCLSYTTHKSGGVVHAPTNCRTFSCCRIFLRDESTQRVSVGALWWAAAAGRGWRSGCAISPQRRRPSAELRKQLVRGIEVMEGLDSQRDVNVR
jgi:hypothetical protein